MNILALHGFTGCGADFAPLAEQIGGTWHCPALPGHGAHPQLDCSPEATLAYIQKEASKSSPPFKGGVVGSSDRGDLQPSAPHLPQVSALKSQPSKNILLGYSMGARAALLHAIQHPDAWDALILISGNPGIEDKADRAARRTADAELAASIERLGMEQFLEFWQETPLIRSQKGLPADLRTTMQASRLKNTTEGLANSLRQFGQGSCPNLWPELNKLTMPLLLITGEQDQKYTAIAQRMASDLSTFHFPPSTHRIIDGMSHAPHLEGARETSKIIQHFISKLKSATG